MATQLPLSGREPQPTSATVTQQTQMGASSSGSVNAIDSSVMVQGALSGSVPAAQSSAGELRLTLEDALARGLRENLSALNQSAAVQQARGQRAVARSQLLPQLNTEVSEAFERLNLRTQGVEIQTFPEGVKFNFYDARAARLNQSILDFVKLDNLHVASETLLQTIQTTRNTRDLIVLAVAGTYLQLVATGARIEAAEAQVETSGAIYEQAADRLDAGLATRVDVTRSQVQWLTDQQRLRSLAADLETEKLRLARIVGLALGQRYVLEDQFPFSPLTDFDLDSALARASQNRADLRSAEASIRAAEQSVRAAHAERLPLLSVNADFGAAGITPTHSSIGVYSVSGTLSVPLYEGGRIRGDIEQASASLRQRKAELEDLRGQVDQDVRQAFINLEAAADQIVVAQSNVELSHQTLEQSRDRFLAGVADTVEVVQAEQAVVQADDDVITANFEHNLAKVALARAMGIAEQTLPQLLRK